jgi:hypothetical protein
VRPIEIPTVSIIDTILQLDEYLSGDVRRAEKTARFCSKPWLEADIDELVFELDQLTDARATPTRPARPRSVSRPGPRCRSPWRSRRCRRSTAPRSSRSGWRSCPRTSGRSSARTWREALDKGAPYPDDFYDALIGVSAKTPAITAEQAAGLRTKLGDPQMDALAKAAWDVNTNSGVSIPKSPLSSHVLRQAARAQS